MLLTEGGPGKDMSFLQDVIGERRLQEAMSQAELYLDNNSTEVPCDSRFQPLGGG